MALIERPRSLVLVVGTATEVGKTWVTCRIAEELRRRGVTVAARKPAQSFDPGDDAAGVTDAHLLAAATDDRADRVTPEARWYPLALAPPMAAAALGRPAVRIADLVAETIWPPGTAVGLLESAGSACSPLADDGDAVVLAARVRPDHVLLVADATLGAIGAVRANAAALSGHRITVLLNRYDATDRLHRANRDWLTHRDRFRVHVDPHELVERLH